MKCLSSFITLCLLIFCSTVCAKDHKGITQNILSAERFTLIEQSAPVDILIAADEMKGIRIAAENLQKDFARVSGKQARLLTSAPKNRCVIVGSMQSAYIQQIIKVGKLKGGTD